MRKIAVCAGVILAVVVCSIFFSKIVLSITTPKVKFAEVGYKRFEEQISRNATIYFEKTDKFNLDDARKTPITVDQLNVRMGDKVAAGDILCTANLSNAFSDEVDAASDALVTAQQAYMKNETDNIKLVDTLDSDKNEAKRAMDDTSRDLADAQAKLLGEATKVGIQLGDDTGVWPGIIQKSGDAELISLVEILLDAQSAADRAGTAFLDTFTNSKTKTEVYEFLLKRAELQRDLDKAQNKLVDLVSAGESMTSIRAEHEGYIVALGIEEGKVYDGNTPAYELTSLGQNPVLRCEVTGIKREFSEGMPADIKAEYGDIRAEVSALIREGVDRRYLHIPLTDEMISQLGGVRTLQDNGVIVKFTYRAKEAASILPPAAVRSEGDGKGDFIYVSDKKHDIWGSYLVARKLPVTVLERGDKEVSVQEDLRYGSRPVYQESKMIKEGGRIEEFLD